MEHPVAVINDLVVGSMVSVEAGAVRVVLFLHEDGTVSALEDRCSHADVRLSRGSLKDGEVQCPAHGARFDAKTGEQRCMPAVSPVKSFPVRVVEGQVLVTVE